jgi:transposase
MVGDLDAGATRIYIDFEYRRVACPHCKAVKRETLSMLAKSARFTQRFEDRIGLLCREMSIKRVAELNTLSWNQVCRMEKSYMRRLLEQHPPSQQLRTIGIDEISTRKGHTYAIVVADLDQRRPIWLGGQGRTEQDLQLFFDTMGSERCKTIELTVMDMWKPFRKATRSHAPNAQIVYDKFHIMRHLADALDQVRGSAIRCCPINPI